MKWVLAVSIAVVGGLAFFNVLSEPAVPSVELAQQYLSSGEYFQAVRTADQLLRETPDDPLVLIVAGEAATRLSNHELAIEYYSRVSRGAGQHAATAAWAKGEILAHIGHVEDAEIALREALEESPELHDGKVRLASLLTSCGRRWEANAILFDLVRHDQFTMQQLLLLGNTAKLTSNRSELQRYLAAAPHQLIPNLGLARIAFEDGAPSESVALLQPLLREQPELVEAHVQFGKAILQGGGGSLSSWAQALPENATSHPDIWVVQGDWAVRENIPRGAARCYLEAIRRDPNHAVAHYRLSQVLESFGATEQSSIVAERARKLEQFAVCLEQVYQNPEYLPPVRQAGQLAYELGRFWEARGWFGVSLGLKPDSAWARDGLRLANSRLSTSTPQTSPTHALASNFEFANYPLPDFSGLSNVAVAGDEQHAKSPVSLNGESIRFKDVAQAFGMLFSYFPSRLAPTRSHRMFEITGGGVGILDFDADGWPDIYLSQGSSWPPRTATDDPLDCLFRNVGGQSFANATLAAGITEKSYSQGVAVGDVNNDGFDDLYVANIGANRLFINNGDGTFSDANGWIKQQSIWTTSCAIADLTGDGLPEIFDTNYVTGHEVFSKLCMAGGKARACSPLEFTPLEDRILLNAGTGQSGNFVRTASMSGQPGNGLGVVVLRTHGRAQSSIFVANDQVANAMLSIENPTSPSHRFEDRALVSGLAYDHNGRAQACMGVAAGDANNDGRTDLFVTNFFRESNALYLQQPTGNFVDAAVTSNLAAPSLGNLGFGTQFIDAQLDGWLDLVVENGHIDDMTHLETPFQMKPQFFCNQGEAVFESVKLPDYFSEPKLGRAMASLDFNRDGLPDLAVTHLDSPVALLKNESSKHGGYLAVRVRGVESGLDAIGTTLHLYLEGKQLTRQLTGGSGYLSSNQKLIMFGLGSAKQIERLVVDWPSGKRSEFSSVDVNSETLVVEGSDRLFTLHK